MIKNDHSQLTTDYLNLLKKLKSSIVNARIKAALSLNKEVIQLYWQIGIQLIEKQKNTNWGDKILDRLSNDLRHAFPEMKGFSKTNLKYMRIFAHFYPTGFGQQPVDQLPWRHLTLLVRIKNEAELYKIDS